GYDHQGRRISKLVEVWTNSAWVVTSNLKFIYDRWNLLAELNATNNNVINSFMWGLDLSGSEHGAGGVGGLLAFKPSGGAAHFVPYDGSGNVMGLVDGSIGSSSAQYEYSPFGETLRMNGVQGSANALGFSSKYTDRETDLLYYGYRLYCSATGRWVNRDPIAEHGGLNIYLFVQNNASSHVDLSGKDFIAVSGRRVKGAVIFDHYAIEWWMTCDPAPEKEQKVKKWQKKGRKVGSVELIGDPEWKVRRVGGAIDDVWVSLIKFHTAKGEKFVSVYTGSPQQVKSKFREIAQLATRYEFGEIEPEVLGFKHWPNSKYGFPPPHGPFNNSNTFVREILKRVSVTMKELQGNYVGNKSPVEVPDVYNGNPYKPKP
ncbi:MAG: RHS repeat-associated core domain-containing protein, partial [Verrucomicrobiota bacterium]